MKTNLLESLLSTDPSSTLPLEQPTKESIIRFTRQAMMAELDAANLYEQIAESLPEEYLHLAEVYRDIAEEEIVHMGEFLKVVHELDPANTKLLDDGVKEASELHEKIVRTREAVTDLGAYLYFDSERRSRGLRPWVLKDIATDAPIASFKSKSDAKHYLSQNS